MDDDNDHCGKINIVKNSLRCNIFHTSSNSIFYAIHRLNNLLYKTNLDRFSPLRERAYNILVSMLAKLDNSDVVTAVDNWCDHEEDVYRFPTRTEMVLPSQCIRENI